MENLLIRSCIDDRKFFEDTKDYLDKDKDFGPIGTEIYRRVAEFYDKDDKANSVPVDFLKASIDSQVKKKIATSLCAYIDGLPSHGSSSNTLSLLSDTKRNAVSLRLATALANNEGKETVAGLIEEYQKWADLEDIGGVVDNCILDFNKTSVKELIDKNFSKENLIKLWPKALNERIDGGARPGHHIVVFAHTNVGKTLFAINLVAGFVKQKLRVLYCGNEDPVVDIGLRTIVRLTQLNKFEVQNDPDNAHALAMAQGLDLIRFADLSPGTFSQIGKLCDEYQPHVVVLDQLRNIAIKRDGSRAESLEALATAARTLGKKKKTLVVSLTQAGAAAENKLVLDMGDMDSSKVGIPGQADLIIAIGADQNTRANGLRMVNLAKNKLSGKHEFFEVEVNEQLGTVKSI